jgi:hypothetical protein
LGKIALKMARRWIGSDVVPGGDEVIVAGYLEDQTQTGTDYDGLDDFAKFLDVGYAAIRQRVADGGPGWTPNPAPPQPAPSEPAAEPDDGIPAFLRRMAS